MKYASKPLIVLLLLVISLNLSVVSAENKVPVINLVYDISDNQPSSIDRDMVENSGELLKKPFKTFGKDIKNIFSVRVLHDIDGRKTGYMNAIVMLKAVHIEYSHGKEYESSVKFNLQIRVPGKGAVFEKEYSSNSKLELGSQWAKWIAINKVARHALKKTFECVLFDSAFKQAISSIDTGSFFSAKEVLEIRETFFSATTAGNEKSAINTKERLLKLNSLKESNLITEEEYKKKKQQILEDL